MRCPALLFLLLSASVLGCGGRSQLRAAEGERSSGPPAVEPGEVIVACGDYHTCAARAGGPAYCWGAGAAGQLGRGQTSGSSIPVQVRGVDDVVSLAGGGAHSCAIVADGSTWCWGSNRAGRLGDGSTTDRLVPVQVTGLDGARQVCAGFTHTCAEAHGRLFCWGTNSYGELGTPSHLEPTTTPIEVPGVEHVVDLTCGNGYTCAVGQTGEVICWGHNLAGQIVPGADSLPPTSIPSITDADEVSAGSNATCVRHRSHRVSCWGGIGSHVPVGWPPVEIAVPGAARSLDARGSASCAVSEAGVSCWGITSQVVDIPWPGSNEPAVAGGTEGAVRVAVGGVSTESHACAVTTDNRLLCWGRNSEGQVGNGTHDVPTAPSVVELP